MKSDDELTQAVRSPFPEAASNHEQDRIIVRQDGEVTTMQYNGTNPGMRYLPREKSV